MTRSRRSVLPALALLLPGLLAACTGTEEPSAALRLAVLTDGGATLRGVSPGVGEITPVSVTGGVGLDPLPSGRQVALTLASGIESRDVNLQTPAAFAPLPFSPVCLTNTVLSATRDRLLTLSACNGVQQLALYRVDGSLVWTALLPTFIQPVGTDVPPVRLAVLGEVGVVARPALGGGSETIRVAVQTTGAATATPSTPLPTAAIRDLASQGGAVYAATDTGVQPLNEQGAPDAGRTLSAFGSARVDRLWTGAGSGTGLNLFAAWRDAALSGNGTEPLRLWDGARAGAVTVADVAELRDLTFAPDGNLYALTRTALTSYNTTSGLSLGDWRPATVLGGLNDARSVTWLVP